MFTTELPGSTIRPHAWARAANLWFQGVCTASPNWSGVSRVGVTGRTRRSEVS
jgi:hypothetical protein